MMTLGLCQTRRFTLKRGGGSSDSVPPRCQGLPEKRQHPPFLCGEPLDRTSRVRLA
jgi:hypothetical protein